MAGIGLGWSAGNDAMAQNIRQQIADQLMAEQRKKQDAQQAFENDLRTKQFQSGEDMKRAQLDALIANRGAEQQDRTDRIGGALAEQLPAGTTLPADAPAVGMLNRSGRGALLSPQPNAIDAPPDALAANPDAGPQILPGTIANAPSPIVGRLVVKGATQTQAEKSLADQRAQEEADRKATADANKTDPNDIPVMTVGPNGQPIYTKRSAAIGQRAYVKPTADQTVVIQTVDPDTGQNVTEIVPKTAGASFAGRASPEEIKHNRAVRDASGDLDETLKQVDSSDKAGVLGPVNGRVFGQFLAGTVGSTGDPKMDEQLGKIRSAIGTLKMSYPPAVSGSTRGGAAMSKLMDTLNSDKFSAASLRGAVNEMKGAMDRRQNGKGDGSAPKQIHYDANGQPIQ